MKRFECVIELGKTNPTRLAETKEEFIENIIAEYNEACGELFSIDRSNIKWIYSTNEEVEDE